MEIIHETGSTQMVFHDATWDAGMKPFHWHEKIEIVIPKNRPMGALIDGVWYEARPGDILVVGEEKIHAFRIDSEATEVLLGQFPYRHLLLSGELPYALSPLIRREEIEAIPALSSALSSILAILTDEGRVTDSEKNPFMQAMCASLYFLLMRHFPAPEEAEEEKRGKRDFYKIVAYVNDHFTEGLTVGGIARTLYIDRGKLSRLFTTYAGMSLPAYINALRIRRATHLIRGGAAITEAALEAGFQSVRTFHEVYRREVGTTPRELKR